MNPSHTIPSQRIARTAPAGCPSDRERTKSFVPSRAIANPCSVLGRRVCDVDDGTSAPAKSGTVVRLPLADPPVHRRVIGASPTP
jgi:hypothetical protein